MELLGSRFRIRVYVGFRLNLTKDQISQLMKDLADAYKQLEALEAGVPESSVRTVR